MDRHPNHTPRVKYFIALCSTEGPEDAKKVPNIIANLEDVVENAPYLGEAIELLFGLYDKHKMTDKIRNFVENKVCLCNHNFINEEEIHLLGNSSLPKIF